MKPPYLITPEDRRRERKMRTLLERIKTEERKETQSALWVEYQALNYQRPEGFVRILEEKLGLCRG